MRFEEGPISDAKDTRSRSAESHNVRPVNPAEKEGAGKDKEGGIEGRHLEIGGVGG